MQYLLQNIELQNGKYKIERVLGQGGFGITYLASQTILGGKVAIKEFFFKDLCDREQCQVVINTNNSETTNIVTRFKEKFLKEAKTISRLHHENIVSIYDVFEENNTAYYVMEYVEGNSLEQLVQCNGALSENEAIQYIKQIANALDYIHQKHINHLDVKPANIMIRRSDSKAILIDFGISKQYDAQGDQTSTTPVGISYGYAPMEQYTPGGVSEFSPQTDIYALGATLYRLVTGMIPPQASEIINNGLPTLPLSLSKSLKNLIVKSMQVRKVDRPQTISIFLDILNAFSKEQHSKTNYRKSEYTNDDTKRIGYQQFINKKKDIKGIDNENSITHRIARMCGYISLIAFILFWIIGPIFYGSMMMAQFLPTILKAYLS